MRGEDTPRRRALERSVGLFPAHLDPVRALGVLAGLLDQAHRSVVAIAVDPELAGPGMGALEVLVADVATLALDAVQHRFLDPVKRGLAVGGLARVADRPFGVRSPEARLEVEVVLRIDQRRPTRLAPPGETAVVVLVVPELLEVALDVDVDAARGARGEDPRQHPAKGVLHDS